MTVNNYTRAFIRDHSHDDVDALALQRHRYPQVDMAYALTQIAGRQKAAQKLPVLLHREGVVFPPRLSMEQCSSQEAATEKARIVRRLIPPAGRQSLVDLTGGFGVDFFALQMLFREAVYVERDDALATLAAHNLRAMGCRAVVVHDEAEAYLRRMSAVSLIFVDPARRDVNGRRTYAISDCRPDVVRLQSDMLRCAPWCLVKLSPMLDWHEACRELQGVSEVHVVAVGGECKELLLVLRRDFRGTPRLFTVNGAERYEPSPEGYAAVSLPTADPVAGQTLCVPNAAVMKAGCFRALCHDFRLCAIAPDSHLFLSPSAPASFPGRCMAIAGVSDLNPRHLSALLAGVGSANVAVRHFPLKAEALRRKLKLADGGRHFVFGTTLRNGRHVVLLASNKHF